MKKINNAKQKPNLPCTWQRETLSSFHKRRKLGSRKVLEGGIFLF
jgi:hypothetical protein